MSVSYKCMNRRRFLIFLIVIILIIDLAYFYPKLTGHITKSQYKLEPAFCKKVIDGDTIEIEINHTAGTVRLLGINTPEKGRVFYEDAQDFLKQIENKTIYIQRDYDNEDKYDRLLRYVFYEDNFMNEQILENGLANLYIYGELFHQDELESAQEKARLSQRGIWKKSNSKCRDCIELLELNAEDEYFILKNHCSFQCELEGKDEANHFFDITLSGEEEKTIHSKGRVWNNDGDSLFLRDEDGLLLYYTY